MQHNQYHFTKNPSATSNQSPRFCHYYYFSDFLSIINILVAIKIFAGTFPATKLALEIYSDFCDDGNGSKDFSAISKVIGGDAWDYPIE